MSAPRTPFPGMRGEGSPAIAERIYRLLLRAYPPAFRVEYGREMTQIFRDQCRTGEARTLGFWVSLAWDVVKSAPALHLDAWRTKGGAGSRTLGVRMKPIALLTVLLGVLGVLSSALEGVAGMRQGLGGTYLFSTVLAVVAGALLLAAGVVALRGTPSSRGKASRAAVASLVMFLLARLVFGWMSVFLQLVGIGLPLVILTSLHWPRRSGNHVSGAAALLAAFTLGGTTFGAQAVRTARDAAPLTHAQWRHSRSFCA